MFKAHRWPLQGFNKEEMGVRFKTAGAIKIDLQPGWEWNKDIVNQEDCWFRKKEQPAILITQEILPVVSSTCAMMAMLMNIYLLCSRKKSIRNLF